MQDVQMIPRGEESLVAPRVARDRVEARDGDAFADWIMPHWPAMRQLAERLAGRDRRDDVLQEALSSAWRSWARYDAGQGTERAWLLGITANHARKSWRLVWRYAVLDDVVGTETATDRIDVRRAVSALPARQRLAVELFYFLGLPVDEVASVMGCAVGTVKSTLSAARARIRDELGEDY